MATIPLAANNLRIPQQPNPLEAIGQLQQLRAGQIQMQQQQQSMNDVRGLIKAAQEANGDPDRTAQLALQKYGVSPITIGRYREQAALAGQQMANKTKAELEVAQQQRENQRGALTPFVDLAKQSGVYADNPQSSQPSSAAAPAAPAASGSSGAGGLAQGGEYLNPRFGNSPTAMSALNPNGGMVGQPQSASGAQPQQINDPLAGRKQHLWTMQRAEILKNPENYGITDASAIPEQYPGDDWVMLHDSLLEQGDKLHQEAVARQQVEAGRTPESHYYNQLIASGMSPDDAFAKLEQMKNQAKPKMTPFDAQTLGNLNQQLTDRWQVLNPGKPLPSQYALQPGATQTDFDRTDKALEAVERAQGTKAQQDMTRQLQIQSRNTSRSDKSYQFNSAQLEKVAQPVDQMAMRLGRLKDTLAMQSPQADALVAPELLTVMAGGQGSGLRMNEAEIARIVGGRSNWEALKATLNKWSLDPTHANSITPAQRQQMNDLVDAVNQKVAAKQQILDKARNDLYATDDPLQHRSIVGNARMQLNRIDYGGPGSQGNQGGPPLQRGYTRIQASDGGIHDVPNTNMGKAKQRDPGLQVIQQN